MKGSRFIQLPARKIESFFRIFISMPFAFFKKTTDPVERRRQELSAQEKLLARQLSELEDQMRARATPRDPNATPKNPAAVWRAEVEPAPFPMLETDPELRRQSRRTLSAQRNRDRNRFFVLAALLLVILFVVLHRCTSN